MDLFDLFCRIVLNDEDYQRGLDSAKKGTKSFAKDAGKTISDFAKKAENSLKTAAKIGTAAITAASAGVGLLVKSAVQEYADYEQLVGGIETLFKESADVVQNYAANAYKTAGLSANDYMETVTSFSASLLQSLGGDTAEAARLADLAITDMSDNSNKMGTDMEMIQNAYRGFAKQNFTMLDNLAIGYGGTKEEMQRLLDDANALNAAQGKLTSYSIDSYADMVLAIHDVQTQMGITGTTAKEASTTIQGSVNSAKAAWHNLLIGVADDNQDFDELVDQFVDSVDTAADNILPRVEKSLNGILKLVTVASEKIVPRVIATLSEQAPALIEAGADIILALGEGIVNNADQIFNSVERIANRLIPKLARAFTDLVPKIAQSAANIIDDLDGVAETVGGIYMAFKSLTKGNWIGFGIGLFVTAFGELRQISAEVRDEIKGVTDADKKLHDAASDAAYSLLAATEASKRNTEAIEIEAVQTQDLWAELQTLTDENGKVLDGNQERAEYILGELNDALGTEYELNGGIIDQYQQMQAEIDNLIAKRRAERLIENGEEAYNTARENRDTLLEEVAARQQELQNAQNYLANLQNNPSLYFQQNKAAYEQALAGAQSAVNEAQADFDAAQADAVEAVQTVTNYETALVELQKGNYEEAANLMSQDSVYRWQHVRNIKAIGEAEKAQLKSDLDSKRRAVDTFRAEYEKGTSGFTQPMLAEMEGSLKELAGLWTEASGEAYDCGVNLGLGLVDGMNSTKGDIAQVGRRIINSALDAMKMRAEIASPSKVTRGFGRFVGLGLGLGIEDEKDFVSGKASGLMQRALSAMNGYSPPISELPVAQATGGRIVGASAPINISITVHADTDDLGDRIARELQAALDGVLAARGNSYRNGRTDYAY